MQHLKKETMEWKQNMLRRNVQAGDESEQKMGKQNKKAGLDANNL